MAKTKMSGFKFQDIPKLEELVKKMTELDRTRKAAADIRGDVEFTLLHAVNVVPSLWISRPSSTVRLVLLDDDLARDITDALSAYEKRCEETLAKIELSVA